MPVKVDDEAIPAKRVATSNDDGLITLTVTTFGTMGLDGLYAQYEKDHPNITIKATNIDTGGNALTDWKTKPESTGRR